LSPEVAWVAVTQSTLTMIVVDDDEAHDVISMRTARTMNRCGADPTK
jgi:hypothetical protein